jgi:hypothetical protein
VTTVAPAANAATGDDGDIAEQDERDGDYAARETKRRSVDSSR